MTYRNDHDAAIARIETLEYEQAHLAQANAALERENAQLRGNPITRAPSREPKPKPAPSGESEAMRGLIGVLLVGFAVVVLYLFW